MNRGHLARCLAIAAVLTAGGSALARQNDPNAGSDVVGHMMPARGPMAFIGVPPAAQGAMKTNAERLWAIVMGNPALNPPIGFNLRPDFIAHGYLLPGKPEDAPYTCAASGYLYWYRFMPGANRVQALPVAMVAFFVHANRLSVAFSGRTPWQQDDAGAMFLEPREIGRVGGYPQYENGVIVITDGSRPVWRPVSRERLLKFEMGRQRKTLDGMAGEARKAAASDPERQLEKWLAERPKRQREAERMYEQLKRVDAKAAEQSRMNFAKTEEQVEKTLRNLIPGQKQQAATAQVSAAATRGKVEECIRYLEGEMTRLSADERAAPGYVTMNPPPSQRGCSSVVDTNFSGGAHKVVAEDVDFFDRRLPRTAIQAILVDFSNFEHLDGRTADGRAYQRLRDGIDYHAFAALLKKR